MKKNYQNSSFSSSLVFVVQFSSFQRQAKDDGDYDEGFSDPAST